MKTNPNVTFHTTPLTTGILWYEQTRERNTKGTDLCAGLFEARVENVKKLYHDTVVVSVNEDQMEPEMAFDPENQRSLVVWTNTSLVVGRIYAQFVWLNITDLEHNYSECDSLWGVADAYYQFISSPYADDIVFRPRNVSFEGSQDNRSDGDGSPLDGNVRDRLGYVISNFERAETREGTSQNLEITYKFFTTNEETSPKIFYAISGEPFVVWSGKSSRATYKVTFERKRNSENDPWYAITSKETYVEDRDSNVSIFARLYMLTIPKDLTFSDTSKNSHIPAFSFDPQSKMWVVVPETKNKIHGRLFMMKNNMPYGPRIRVWAVDESGPYSCPNLSFGPVNQRYMVVWEDVRNDSSKIPNIDVYGQFIDPEGNPPGASFPIVITAGNQLHYTLCFGDFDFRNFLALWKDGSNPEDAEVYGQLWAYSAAPRILLTNEDVTPLYTSLLDFGSVEVGSSANETFQIWNFGNQTLTIENVSDPSSPLGIEPPFAKNIAPGSYYSMQLKFAPVVVASYAYLEGNTFISAKSNGGYSVLYLSGVTSRASTTGRGTTLGEETRGGTTPGETEEKTGGGAKGRFIAEASFESYLHPYVAVLKDFKDRYLLRNSTGKIFVKFYYRYASPVAEVIRKHGILKVLVRVFLVPLVRSIKYSVFLFFSLGAWCFFLIKRQIF